MNEDSIRLTITLQLVGAVVLVCALLLVAAAVLR